MNSFLLTTNLLITPEMTPVGKPYPDPLLKACDLLNVTPSEALYVGDMSSDCDSASAANIDFAGLIGGMVSTLNIILFWIHRWTCWII